MCAQPQPLRSCLIESSESPQDGEELRSHYDETQPYGESWIWHKVRWRTGDAIYHRCRGRIMPLRDENGLAGGFPASLNINLDPDHKHRADSNDNF